MDSKWLLRWSGACVVALACGTPAAAVERGMYITPGYGFNKIDVKLQEFDFIFQSLLEVDFTSSSLDRSTRGLALTMGYQFNPYLAVEGGWIELGRIRYDFSFEDSFGAQHGRITNRSRGFAVNAVGSLPLGELFLLEARAGALFADNKLRLEDLATGDSGSVSDRKTALFFGGGVTFFVTPYTGIHAGVTRYRKASFGADVDQFSIGIRYSYGQ